MGLIGKLHMIHRCWKLRFRGEVSSIRFLRSLRLGGTTLLDIGANKGVYSIYMSRAAGEDGRVMAFEAQPELGAHLHSVKQAFGLDNLQIISFGLSSSTGTLTMRRPHVGSGGATFYFLGEAVEGMEELKVPVTTLDEFLGDHDDPVSFIKCDVEGHEHDVFLGAERTLKTHMPTLLFESGRAVEEKDELFRYLVDLGYDGYFFHVTPKDHNTYLHRGRGHYIHYSEHANHPHCRPSVFHRNYFFVPQGTQLA
jgi:FkbM family methyltransferase